MLKRLSPHCTVIYCDDCAEGYEYLGDVNETYTAFARDGWQFDDGCQCPACAKEWSESC